jgi:hypothetical protein
MQSIRHIAVTFVILLGLGGLFWLGVQFSEHHRVVKQDQIHSLGPTISQLDRISELVPIRIHVADVLIAEGEGYRGSWLIKGDAVLSCDASRAKIVQIDSAARSATLRLPPLRVASARVDHERTRTWNVGKTSWLPWSGGDQNALRDTAMYHAQRLIEEAALSDRNLEPARSQTATLIQQMYEVVGWDVAVEWEHSN